MKTVLSAILIVLSSSVLATTWLEKPKDLLPGAYVGTTSDQKNCWLAVFMNHYQNKTMMIASLAESADMNVDMSTYIVYEGLPALEARGDDGTYKALLVLNNDLVTPMEYVIQKNSQNLLCKNLEPMMAPTEVY